MLNDQTLPYAIAASNELQDAEEHVEYLQTFMTCVEPTMRIASQRIDIYPCIWQSDGEGGLIRIGPRVEANVSAWEESNRRLAARVLHIWGDQCRASMPGRRACVAWREGRGVGEWKDGLYIEITVLFDGEEIPGFRPGLPADPAPLSEAERNILVKACTFDTASKE